MEKDLDRLGSKLQETINMDAKSIYSEKAIQYAAKPENVGRMNDPDGSAVVKGLCGDTMEMYLVISDDKISEALFHTDGCGVTLACGTAATKLAKGKDLKDALRISPADIIDELDGLPGENLHCGILAATTLHRALAEYLLKRQM